MSDFAHLDAQRRSLLQIKLDGHVEAGVQAARLQGIGLTEALTLLALALLREFSAHGVDRGRAERIWREALAQTWPEPADTPLN